MMSFDKSVNFEFVPVASGESLEDSQRKSTVLSLKAEWTLGCAGQVAELMDSIQKLPGTCQSLSINCDKLGAWDGLLLLVLHRIRKFCLENKIALDLSQVPDNIVHLLEMAAVVSGEERGTQTISWLHNVGDWAVNITEKVKDGLEFVGDIVFAFFRMLNGTSRMRFCDFREQIYILGPQALLIVTLIAFLMGVILAFIGAIPLQWFGAETYVASLVGIGMLRLLAPVMVGVVMAGRSAASFAAELGTMRVNQEIDSFTILGLHPMDLLIMPRFLAMVLMFPLLCFFADVVSVIGGGLVGMFYLHLSWMEYYFSLTHTVRLSDFYVGLFSVFVFAWLVAGCGCYNGIKCKRNAEAVGQATTKAVVSSIVAIVFATSTITIISVVLKI